MDLAGIAGSERLQIEDGGRAGVQEEAAIYTGNLHSDNGQNIAALDGDFVFGGVSLGTGLSRQPYTEKNQGSAIAIGFTESSSRCSVIY